MATPCFRRSYYLIYYYYLVGYLFILPIIAVIIYLSLFDIILYFNKDNVYKYYKYYKYSGDRLILSIVPNIYINYILVIHRDIVIYLYLDVILRLL